jgi:hypothetical protein
MWMLTTNQPLDCLSIIVPPHITASAPTTTVIRWGISVQVLELPQLNSGTHTIGRTASERDRSQ